MLGDLPWLPDIVAFTRAGDPRCVPPLPAKQQSHQERNAGSAAAPTVQPSLSAVRVPRKRQDSYDLIDLRSPNPLFVTHSPFKHSQSAPSMEGGESRLQPTVRPLSPLRNRSPTGDVVSCHHAADPQLPQVVTARRTRELLHANEDQSEQGHTVLDSMPSQVTIFQ